MHLTITHHDVTAEVEVLPDGRVEAAGERFAVVRAGNGRYVVSGGGRQSVVHAAEGPDGLHLFFEGMVYELEVRERGATPRGRAIHELLEAPMPATVVQILASPGQRIAAGETLLTLEAMKMQLPVRAPRAGTVSAVHCKLGQLVQPGTTLIELTDEM